MIFLARDLLCFLFSKYNFQICIFTKHFKFLAFFSHFLEIRKLKKKNWAKSISIHINSNDWNNKDSHNHQYPLYSVTWLHSLVWLILIKLWGPPSSKFFSFVMGIIDWPITKNKFKFKSSFGQSQNKYIVTPPLI